MPSKLSYLPNVLKLIFEATEDSSTLFPQTNSNRPYKKRLSQNRVEMASFVSSPIEVIWIFLKKGVYKLTFEGFILSNFFFRCHKPPKRLLLQDYVQWPAGRTQFQPS